MNGENGRQGARLQGDKRRRVLVSSCYIDVVPGSDVSPLLVAQ